MSKQIQIQNWLGTLFRAYRNGKVNPVLIARFQAGMTRARKS